MVLWAKTLLQWMGKLFPDVWQASVFPVHHCDISPMLCCSPSGCSCHISRRHMICHCPAPGMLIDPAAFIQFCPFRVPRESSSVPLHSLLHLDIKRGQCQCWDHCLKMDSLSADHFLAGNNHRALVTFFRVVCWRTMGKLQLQDRLLKAGEVKQCSELAESDVLWKHVLTVPYCWTFSDL